VLQKFKLDNYTSEIRVVDSSGEIWHTQVLNQKYRFLREGQYVRIRQATLQNHKNYHRVFGMKSHTNIMTLPYPCKIAQEMYFDEEKLVSEFETDLLQKQIEGVKSLSIPLAHPVVVTTVTSKKDQDGWFLPMTDLRQLIDGEHAKTKPQLGLETANKNLFRCRFNVNATLPDAAAGADVMSFLKVFNDKTGAVRALSSKTDKPKANEKLCIFVQLICKDPSTFYSGDFVRINILQTSSVGFFNGIAPQDLVGSTKKQTDTQLRFLTSLRTLLRFNVHVEAMICSEGGKSKVYVVTDTQLKQYS